MALASHFTIVRFVLILFAGWAALSACDSSSPAEEESPYAIADFLEMKTLWHPIGR